MSRKVQFVAVVLALVVLAGPGAALAACWSPQMTATGHHCCPTMRSHPGVQMKGAGQTSPCCNITAGKSVPPSVMQAPGSKVTVAPIAIAAVVLALPVAPARHVTVDPVFVPELASPQAVLCTFLI